MWSGPYLHSPPANHHINQFVAPANLSHHHELYSIVSRPLLVHSFLNARASCLASLCATRKTERNIKNIVISMDNNGSFVFGMNTSKCNVGIWDGHKYKYELWRCLMHLHSSVFGWFGCWWQGAWVDGWLVSIFFPSPLSIMIWMQFAVALLTQLINFPDERWALCLKGWPHTMIYYMCSMMVVIVVCCCCWRCGCWQHVHEEIDTNFVLI